MAGKALLRQMQRITPLLSNMTVFTGRSVVEMSGENLNHGKGQSEMILGAFIDSEGNNSKLQIAYEIDGQQDTLDLAKLSILTDSGGCGFYHLENKKYIHFYDVSGSDLNHIMGICAFLYYREPPISQSCNDYDPCLWMGLTVNDNGGIVPELHDCSYFVQGRYILKMLFEFGYAKRYELSIKGFEEYISQECGENEKSIMADIWPEYTDRQMGTISVLCVDKAFMKDKLLVSKIESYFMALYNEYHPAEDLAEETLFFDRDCQFQNPKFYFLQDTKDHPYISATPGKYGGHYKLKIYGRLDCPSAARYIGKGQYIKHRVFFKDEETAKAAGYRPCAVCMPEAYKSWKKNSHSKPAQYEHTHDLSVP